MSSQSLFEQLVCLFETHKRQLYVAALAITRERSSAEDAVQDAVLAISELKTNPLDLKAYLFRTVRNKALHCIKQSQRFKADTDASSVIDTNNCSAEQIVFASQVTEHLSTLDSNQQQVIIMKLFAGFTFQQIATITESSPNTVASWYRRGLKQLKEKIHEYQD